MSILRSAWRSLGRQLRHPSGGAGRLVGQAMAIANRLPNRLAIETLGVEAADIVLELGCGPGRAIAVLAALVPAGEVLGIDQSAVMLSQAARYNRQEFKARHVRLYRCRFDALPFPDDVIDKILAVNVLYFFRREAEEIREARRVLRPEGKIAAYVTEKSVMARWKMCTPATHDTFDEQELISRFRSGGFDRQDITIRRVDACYGIAGLLGTVIKPVE